MSVLEKIGVVDASVMFIEAISTDTRAPSEAKQKASIREDGTKPESALTFPADVDILPFALRDDEPEIDVLCIAHPKVIGPVSRARKVLAALKRVGAALKLPNEEKQVVTDETHDKLLTLVSGTPWGNGTKRQKARAGRKPKRKQPNPTQKATYCRMWKQPDQFKPKQIRALASEELGREVEHWELKYWCGDKRTQDGEQSE